MVRFSIILSAEGATAGLESRYPTQAVCSSFFCSSMLGRMCSGFIMTIWVMSHSTRSYVKEQSQSLLHEGIKVRRETNFLDDVEVGKSGGDLFVPEWILLVWQFGRELSSSVFVKEGVSSKSQYRRPRGKMV